MNDPVADLRARTVRRHMHIGWWGLLVFVALGVALETLHGLKVGGYLDPDRKLRRLLWTLAHAHGTLLSLVNITFALTLDRVGTWGHRRLQLASFLLIDALLLLPAGFFLGGIGHSETDPSPGILLVPVGALALVIAVALIAWSVPRSDPGNPTGQQGASK
jgi:hypothetical protein